MKYRQIISGKTTISVSVTPWTEKGMYIHQLQVMVKYSPIAKFVVYNKKKKLDPYMWYEALEASPKEMRYAEWQSLIKELSEMKDEE